ncbi:MAG TPA: SMI1/KNR4 family protein [Polyangiaceae bacterium]|nr:SMI1/KNR4 family protein [Polyangiaceae bacterium]
MSNPQLSRLRALAPPPAQPTASRGDFAEVEAELGAPLPPDWKALIEAYGYGTFVDFLHLWSPFFAPCTMASQARATLDADRQLARAWKKAVPFALFPEPDGALPWANTDNGDVLYWLTWGPPEEWPVAVWSPRGGERTDLVEGGAVEFLVGWLGGARVCPLFPPDRDYRAPEARPRPCFDVWRERTHVSLALEVAVGSAGGGAGAGTYARRLEALVAGLGPVESRGAYGDEDSEQRQVHLLAADGAWRVTYDTVYGHQVRLAAPPAELAAARARITSIFEGLGLRVREG